MSVLIVLMLLFAALIYAPQWWVKQVMRRHAAELTDMPGTGGELAQHLIERFKLDGIRVEMTEEHNDHFDPEARMVRLSPSHFNGRSLTAVAIAAHEVGHAIQFHRREPIFERRARYIPLAIKIQRSGSMALWLAPLFGLLSRSPVAMLLPILISVGLHIVGALTYLIVLPEEWDASFEKALPILEEGYLPAEHLPAARQVLTAAALTYFAAALSSLLSLGYLLLVLRR